MLVVGQAPRNSASFPAPLEALQPGSRIVLARMTGRDATIVALTPDFASAGRPDVSFDGQRVLFLGRQAAAERVNVWELDLNNRQVRRITDSAVDCTAARYLSMLYTLDADEPVPQICFCSTSQDGVSAIYTCHLDGSRVRRITFGPDSASDPLPLSDGRLLYTSRTATGGARSETAPASAARPRARLFTVNTDGTDVCLFAAPGGPTVTPHSACELADGRVLIVERSADSNDAPQRGDALVATARTRSLHSRRVLCETGGRFGPPAPLPSGVLLLPHAPARGDPSAIFQMLPATDQRRALIDSTDWACTDVQRVAPRPPPAGRASVVDDQLDYGYLYCLSAYMTDSSPSGANRPAAIQRVQLFTRAGEDGAAGTCREALLGEAPVEEDGSFYLQVPARTPFRLRTVGADGAVLREMESWIWVMPREARGCIGCHEDRELTPPNRHVLALRKPPAILNRPGPGR